ADSYYPRRAVRLTTVRDGRKERCVGFHKQPIQWAHLGRSAHIVGALECDDSAKGQIRPRVETAARLVGTAREAVQHGARGNAFSTQDVERVVPCLAGVDNQREVALVRK